MGYLEVCWQLILVERSLGQEPQIDGRVRPHTIVGLQHDLSLRVIERQLARGDQNPDVGADACEGFYHIPIPYVIQDQ